MEIKWKMLAEPVPQHVLQMIPVDHKGNMLVLHRSPTVRSAPNCWSFPSGLHDIGETIEQTIRRELYEELKIEMLTYRELLTYENIAGDKDAKEQYHWVIMLVAAMIADVKAFNNIEPDKHDKVEIFPFTSLNDPMWWGKYPFHSSFEKVARPRGHEICNNIIKLLK